MNKIVLEKIAETDPQKADEMQVAVRFIKYYNGICNIDYVLSEKQPPTDDNIDVVAYRKSDPTKKLEMQITVSDAKMREYIGRETANQKRNKVKYPLIAYERITNPGEESSLIKGIKKSIKDKKLKAKKGSILLLDGWWSFGLRNTDLQKLKSSYKDFLEGTDFKEIWIVKHLKSYKLYHFN